MAGILILGVAAAVEAVHGEIADRRSPIICLNADASPLPPSSTLSSSHASRRPSFNLFRSSTSPPSSPSAEVQQLTITITKRALKRLCFDWDSRAAELAYRIREIERHHRAAGVTKCWAGYYKDLPAMKESLTEAKEIRHRLVDAVIYLKTLPSPLKKTSLNPVHRRPKDILPVTRLPPSLNGLPVPLPRPPRSQDFRLVLDKVLPGYDEDLEGGMEERMLRGAGTEEELLGVGGPPSYEEDMRRLEGGDDDEGEGGMRRRSSSTA